MTALWVAENIPHPWIGMVIIFIGRVTRLKRGFIMKIHAGGHRKQIRQKLRKNWQNPVLQTTFWWTHWFRNMFVLIVLCSWYDDIWWHMMTTRRYPGEKCMLCFWCCSNMSKKQDHANNLSRFLPEQPQNIAIQLSNPIQCCDCRRIRSTLSARQQKNPAGIGGGIAINPASDLTHGLVVRISIFVQQLRTYKANRFIWCSMFQFYMLPHVYII